MGFGLFVCILWWLPWNKGTPNRAQDWLRQAEHDFEHYGPLQSRQAIEYAGQIVEFARHAMA